MLYERVIEIDERVGVTGEILIPLDEVEAHAVLVDRYFDIIRHVHVNELDGRHCGTGAYDFKPVLEPWRRRGYQGWISLEAFDFTPGAEVLANQSLRYLESQIQLLKL